MKKFIRILSLILVFGVLLTGCDRALQTVNPMLKEAIKDEEYAMDPPPPVLNTGDCLSQVAPVTKRGGVRALKQCIIQSGEITDPEVLKEILEKQYGITNPEEEESSE